MSSLSCVFWVAVVLGLFALVSASLVVFGIAVFKRGRGPVAPAIRKAAVVIGSVYLALVGSVVFWIGPWRSEILARGHAPDGREFCVVQTYKDFIEPFQVSFYVRDESGVWHWHYLEHEAGFRSSTVTFRPGFAQVKRNGELFREIAWPVAALAASTPFTAEEENSCPATFTVEDVLAFHHARFAGK